jgi:NAD(P)H-hydrate epimerase
MTGAAHLAAAAAQRAGSGYVSLSSPGVEATAPPEVVRKRMPAFDWSSSVLEDLHRFHALVIGPGLGREGFTVEATRATVAAAAVPVVVDGDGLFAMAWDAAGAAPVLHQRERPTVLTPHDGEFGLLAGRRPDADRFAAARRLAADLRSIVLLKGPATIVASPQGDALVVANGDQRLATAGTGDVLSGILGALLATGMDPLRAAGSAAWLHAAAARRCPADGLVAGDVVAALAGVLATLT